ncbi:patatin-like phospholipase family protein [Natronospira sp.]
MARKIRFALIMGGGVSLGAFSAGALARVVKLLQDPAEHWCDPKIDVLSGASAGSMALVMLLHQMYRGASTETIREELRRSWTDPDYMGIRRLMAEHEDPSLFPGQIIDQIAEAFLPFDEPPGDVPHDLFADGTLVSLALSNLNGIPVRAEGQLIRQARTGGGSAEGADSVFADAIQTTYHHDPIRFALHRAPDERARAVARRARARLVAPWDGGQSESWQGMIEAAIASGAFPGAFAPRNLQREGWEYDTEEFPGGIAPEETSYAYVDGGVFRNEPLREAIRLAKIRDAGDEDVERVFIFIDPNISGTSEATRLPHLEPGELTTDGTVEPRDRYSGIAAVLQGLSGAITSQANYRDWLRAAAVNRRVQWLGEHREDIRAIGDALPDSAREGLRAVLESLYRLDAESKGNPDPGVDFGAELTAAFERKAGDRPVSAADELDLLISKLARLEDKKKINLVGITPASIGPEDRVLLKGGFLSGFGGFFDERFREHDFRAGEDVAARVLTAKIDGAKPLVANADQHAPPPLDYDDIGHRDYLSVHEDTRKDFERWTRDQARGAIAEFSNGIVAFFSRFFLRRGTVAGFLSEQYGQATRCSIALLIDDVPRNIVIGQEAETRRRWSRIIYFDVYQSRGFPARYGFHGNGIEAHDGSHRIEVFHRRPGRGANRGLGQSSFIIIDGPAKAWLEKAKTLQAPMIRKPWPGTQDLHLSLDDLIDAKPSDSD